MPRRPPPRVLLAVGLVAGSTLALQVLLTRVFSAVLFYHFGFLAISLALLGVGGGAILIYVNPAWFDRLSLERAMCRWSLAYAALLAVAIVVIVRLDFNFDGVTVGFAFNLAFACLLTFMPFLAAGIVIGLAVRGYTRWIGRVYACDLAGAGMGALVVVPLMWLVDAPTLAIALTAIAALAALLFAGPASGERRAALGGVAAAAMLVALSAIAGLTYVEPQGADPVADRWTPLSRVLGYQPAPGADNGLVVYDRVLGEVVPHRRGTPVADWRRLQTGPQSVGYAVTGPGRALVIGGGGGRDILNALSSGQRRVDVIELNRGIRSVVDDDLAFFSGSPYTLPRVSTTIGDGRSTLAERDTRYDQVHLGFTDTLSASSAQAFALTENNLYTVEAFDEYLDHLEPGGVLNVSRPTRQLGAEALRATVLTLKALERRGVRDPKRHVVVVLGRYDAPFKVIPYGTVLAKLEPFRPAEVRKIRRLAAERGEGVAFAPGGPYRGDWRALERAPSLVGFCEGFRYDVCAPTDDKPFFFHMKRLSDLGGQSTSTTLKVPDPMLVLAVTLVILLALSSLAFVLPLFLVRGAGRPTEGSLLFFAAIGLGFLLLEVVLIQRFVLFLGFPTYALSVVLFSLLVFTGIGSFLSTRLERDPRRALTVTLALACAMLAAGAYGLQPLLEALIELPFGLRVALAVAMLAPLGVTLGLAMPIGLRRLQGLYPQGVAWAWGINGVTSVLASVSAVMIAINFGFAVTMLAALACYLGALAHAALGRWPERATETLGEVAEQPRRPVEPVAAGSASGPGPSI